MRIVLRIMGGLGNQLFQYGAMRLLQYKCPDSQMMIDTGEYKKYRIRNFELSHFDLFNDIKEFREKNLTYEISRRIYRVYQYLYRIIMKKNAPMFIKRFSRELLIYATTRYSLPDEISASTTYMYGYFVDASMLNPIKHLLQSEIRLSSPLSVAAQEYMRLILLEENGVGVSVRCDEAYAKLGWPICSKQYYVSAMNRLSSEKGKRKFFVFADRLDIVKNEGWFIMFDVIFVEGCSIVDCFELLKSCKDFVISNSSFCWWAAWLANSGDKVVYAPNRFFNSAYEEDDKGLFFSEEKFLDYVSGEEIISNAERSDE